MTTYFSEREQGPRPRIEEIVTPGIWGGVVSLFRSLISADAFAERFPEYCRDDCYIIGTDFQTFGLAVVAEIPGLSWPLEVTAPDTLLALDFIEFCHSIVAKSIRGPNHYVNHYHQEHLTFDASEGKESFRRDINRIFSRNKLAYELNEEGQIVRLAPAVLQQELLSATFQSGDTTLDAMLEESREKFLDADPATRREALERLWDCWERMKTLEQPDDKKQSVMTLLTKAADSHTEFLSTLDSEARTLTDIGNSFHIRHSEVSQSAVTDSAHIDYLFHRLFSLINLLLIKREVPA